MPDHGGTLDWNGGGKANAIMQLTMELEKLKTFSRNLEKDIEESGVLKERLTKQCHRIDILESRIQQSEQQVAELDDLKAAAKYANPKMITFAITVLLGGSVAGNTALDTITNGHHETHNQKQDEKLQRLMELINTQQPSDAE